MNLQVRLCALVLVLSWSGSVFAQEEPPLPEDPVVTEPVVPEVPQDPAATESTVDAAPIGTVEIVPENPEQKSPPTEAVPDKTVGDVSLSASETNEPQPAVEEESPLRAGFEIRSEGATANNLDLRPLNNETFIDIFDSDDRTTLLFTKLAAAIAYDASDDTTFTLAEQVISRTISIFGSSTADVVLSGGNANRLFEFVQLDQPVKVRLQFFGYFGRQQFD